MVQITIDKGGKVYLSVSDGNRAQKGDMLDAVNTAKSLNLTAAEKANFVNKPATYIGVPFSQLKSFLQKTPEELKTIAIPGIPVLDSNNNEMIQWIAAAKSAFSGGHMNLVVKGDDAAKYPSFQGVINAFKRMMK